MKTKSGYIAIIGKPNAGKSTLMNAIMGTKLSIVTAKPQTTRKRVLGIYTQDTMQIVFHDTPGILIPRYEMQRSMMDYVHESVSDADVIAVIVDLEKYKGADSYFPEHFLSIIQNINKAKILILNKFDTMKDIKDVLPIIEELTATKMFDDIVPMSALRNNNVDTFLTAAEKMLPEGPFYYDAEILSTQPERFFVSEIIREHVFKGYHEEIPYSTEINVVEFKERKKGKWYISVEVVVERKSQKGILIGKGGLKIKQTGEWARKDIEEHLQRPVFLEIFVKVRDNWRDDKNMLKSFGY